VWLGRFAVTVSDVSDQVVPDEKLMHLRFDGVCRVCGMPLPAKTEAVYERSNKTVRCVSHVEAPSDGPGLEAVIESGTPGASARREFERRKALREQRIRDKYPRLGGLIHALNDEPQSTTAWDKGALGEERLGKRLNELASGRLRVLHDRRIPGTRANIDHLAVTPTGVYVIDPKKYAGRPHLRVEGGLLRPRVEKLIVGTRDCTKLVDGVLRQVDVVRRVIGEAVPVHGVLCFIESDWALLAVSFTARGVEVLWPKKLYPKLRADGPIGIETVSELHRTLASALPPA
jgi:Nuclease-related domain